MCLEIVSFLIYQCFRIAFNKPSLGTAIIYANYNVILTFLGTSFTSKSHFYGILKFEI